MSVPVGGGSQQTLSIADGGPAAEPPGATVGAVLRAAAAAAPDDDAFVVLGPTGRRAWSFAGLLDDATAVARWLIAGGHAGRPVALWSPNTADVVLVQMAVALAGATLVPLNPSLRPDEVRHVLAVSGADLVLAAPAYRGADLPSIVRRVARPGVEVVVLDGAGVELLGRGATASAELPDVDPDSLAQVQFTSGTTGPAKGVRITHRAMALTGRAFADRLGLRRDTPFLNPMPLFHTAGNVLGVMGTLTARTVHVVMEFTPDATLAAIAAERPVVVSLAPTLIHLVAGHPAFADADLSSVTTLFTGGMTMAPEVIADVERRFDARLAITFGMTETCGTAIMTSPADPDEIRRTSVGRAMPLTEAKIVDPVGTTVPVGRPGELLVRGPRITTGYVGDPEATGRAIDADGWLHTGDEASMDADGIFRITGRLKDMIKTGGENVAPVEVEEVVAAHPSVDVVAVVGRPDERWGEIVLAFVVPVAGTTIDLAELTAFCRDRLAPFKTPREWRIVDDLPRTGSGKVQRAVLRAQVDD